MSGNAKEYQENKKLIANTSKEIHLYIVSETGLDSCNFWIGLFQLGALTPSSLCDINRIDEIFYQAAEKGLKETSSLMISDTSVMPARFIYLIPTISFKSEKKEFIKEIYQTVDSWSPRSVGIYLAPELINGENELKLLKDILLYFVTKSPMDRYYLFPGKHGTNLVLNTAIRLKDSIANNGGSNCIHIFH